jgi:membrane-associated phospholipid phosphatase
MLNILNANLRNLLFGLCLFLGLNTISSQNEFPYALDKGIDYPLLGAGILTTGVSIYLDRRVEPLIEEQIGILEIDKLFGFDRYSTRFYSHRAHQVSNVSALASIAFPFALFLDKDNREHSSELLLLTFEGALINAGLINFTKTLVRRPRPFVYNGEAPLELKLQQEARYSFFSGHTAVSSYFTFAGAQMYNDIYPDSRHRTTVWASAAVLPLITGFGRMRAGKHFLTDVLVGYGVGAVLGIIVPRLHRL